MKYTKETLEEAVKHSYSINDVIRFLGRNLSGSLSRHIRTRVDSFGIDTSHFSQRISSKRIRAAGILTTSRLGRREPAFRLRRAMIESGVKYECTICGNSGEWNSQPLKLQIDHINGDSIDNRLENLRFLCPNCHSQTETFASRNIKKNTGRIARCGSVAADVV